MGRWFWRGALAAYLALMLYLTTRPNLHPPLRFEYSDKVAHFGEYAALGFLSRMVAGDLLTGARKRPALVGALVFGFGLLIAGLDETIQRSVPGRLSSWSDFGADVIGILVGLAVAGWTAGRGKGAGGGKNASRAKERSGR